MNRPCCALLRLVPILFVAACGQSGPLYLPGNPSEIQAPAPTGTAEDENDDERDDG